MTPRKKRNYESPRTKIFVGVAITVIGAFLVGKEHPWWAYRPLPTAREAPAATLHVEQTTAPGGRSSKEVGILVLGANHSEHGNNGLYFSFDYTHIDRVLGRTDWNDEVFWVKNGINGKPRLAKFWRRPYPNQDKGTGNGHGRYHPFHEQGNWNVGDFLFIVKSPPLAIAGVNGE